MANIALTVWVVCLLIVVFVLYPLIMRIFEADRGIIEDIAAGNSDSGTCLAVVVLSTMLAPLTAAVLLIMIVAVSLKWTIQLDKAIYKVAKL